MRFLSKKTKDKFSQAKIVLNDFAKLTGLLEKYSLSETQAVFIEILRRPKNDLYGRVNRKKWKEVVDQSKMIPFNDVPKLDLK